MSCSPTDARCRMVTGRCGQPRPGRPSSHSPRLHPSIRWRRGSTSWPSRRPTQRRTGEVSLSPAPRSRVRSRPSSSSGAAKLRCAPSRRARRARGRGRLLPRGLREPIPLFASLSCRLHENTATADDWEPFGQHGDGTDEANRLAFGLSALRTSVLFLRALMTLPNGGGTGSTIRRLLMGRDRGKHRGAQVSSARSSRSPSSGSTRARHGSSRSPTSCDRRVRSRRATYGHRPPRRAAVGALAIARVEGHLERLILQGWASTCSGEADAMVVIVAAVKS